MSLVTLPILVLERIYFALVCPMDRIAFLKTNEELEKILLKKKLIGPFNGCSLEPPIHYENNYCEKCNICHCCWNEFNDENGKMGKWDSSPGLSSEEYKQSDFNWTN